MPDAFAPLRFLAGDWVSVEGGGQPGRASAGEMSFRFELDGHALLRRSFTEFPAQNGKPALRHEDLMTIFPEEGKLAALYLDNEGHTIHYTVRVEPGAVVFESGNAGADQPRQRLTYRMDGPDAMTLAFDLAAPGKEFVNHVHAKVQRKK